MYHHNITTAFAVFIILFAFENTQCEDKEGYDLLPAWSPSTVEFHEKMAKRLSAINIPTADTENVMSVEFWIYIFNEKSVVSITLQTEFGDSKYKNALSHEIEYRYVADYTRNDIVPLTNSFQVSKKIKREMASALRNLLFRINSSSYSDRIQHLDPWMLVDSDGLQGMAYSPYSHSSIGRILETVQALLTNGSSGIVSPKVMKEHEASLEVIRSDCAPIEGSWRIVVNDPFETIPDDRFVERFDLRSLFHPKAFGAR